MKYGIDMGHTLSGPGTGAAKIVKETDINRVVGKLVIKHLQGLGHTVVNCTVDKSDNSLSEIVKNANNNKVEYFLSIHLNAGGGHGTETYVYPGTGGNTKNVAKAINDSVVNAVGFRNRGLKEANFYVLRNTSMPAALLELFFVDSQDDVNKYNANGADKIARAIVKGLTGQDVVDKPVTSGETYYRVVVGSYTDRANAENMVAKLKADGYSAFLDAFEKDGKKFLRVIAGSHKNRANAEREIKELEAKGYKPFIAVFVKDSTEQTEPTPTPPPTPQPPAPSNTDKELKRYSENGRCTVVAKSGIKFRDKPNTSTGKVEGKYSYNESVRYDLVVITERYVWISWIGASSGKRRYMPIKDKKTNERWGNCV